MKRPMIGITAVTSENNLHHIQRVTYAQAIWQAGGEAVLLPCNPDKSNCQQIVKMLDGILAPGGGDVDPVLYGEEKMECCGHTCFYEDEYDMEIIKEAVIQKKPILGICRGMQVINVLYGGTLYQDIPTQYQTEIIHSKTDKILDNYHTVTIEKNSYLAKILGETENVKVNTSHHQAVKDVAEGFRTVAKSPDGIIEALENNDASVVCVQWHPERMLDMEMYRNLFRDFVLKCQRNFCD